MAVVLRDRSAHLRRHRRALVVLRVAVDVNGVNKVTVRTKVARAVVVVVSAVAEHVPRRFQHARLEHQLGGNQIRGDVRIR